MTNINKLPSPHDFYAAQEKNAFLQLQEENAPSHLSDSGRKFHIFFLPIHQSNPTLFTALFFSVFWMWWACLLSRVASNSFSFDGREVILCWTI